MNDLHLAKLRLKNYCSYEDYTFDFLKDNGKPYQFICFFGPNGIGKSTLLEAIALLTMNNKGRSARHVQESLYKFVKNKDYDPLWMRVEKTSELPPMLIEGTYVMDGQEFVVQLTEQGFVRNDFAPIAPDDAYEDEVEDIENSGPWGDEHLLFRQRIAHFVRTDSDLSLSRFQLHVSQSESFEKIVTQIMRYKADCISPSGMTAEEKQYCTDFVIDKKGHLIHFKRMSAGEKKICKSFSSLLNLMYDLENPDMGEIDMPGWPRLLLMDNVVMHVYFDRHVQMVESLKEVFQRQQIFATTHSGILVPRYQRGENDQENELYIDLEPING
jgi:predicted ATP-binding protein involved in virulence